MTNRQLINARWKFTDRLLKQCHKNFKSIFSEIQDELVDLFNSFNLKRENLNKTLSSTDKRKYDRDKRDWKDRNIVTPYFQFLLDTTTKLTYSNVLKIYIFALYLKYSKKEFDECKNLFVAVANNTYEQAKKDLNIKSNDHLTWSLIRDWVIVQTINVPFEDYILILCQTSSEEASRLFINAINQGLILKHSDLSKVIQKQTNRFISINEEKSSGVIENTSRQVGNMAYVEPFPNEKALFVAEMDEKTTPMCKSLNGQIFNTKDWNVFYRYSDVYKSIHKFSCMGLVVGLNMPPISDHFHWCRSTLTYQVDLSSEEVKGLTNDEKYVLNNYISSNSYIVNDLLRNDRPLTKEQIKEIELLSHTLNKLDNYKGQIFRDLQIEDESELKQFLNSISDKNGYNPKQFLSFSTEYGYNKNANVHIVINESSKAKDIRLFNRKENEVLYDKDQKFKLKNLLEKNGTYWIELEEKDA